MHAGTHGTITSGTGIDDDIDDAICDFPHFFHDFRLVFVFRDSANEEAAIVDRVTNADQTTFPDLEVVQFLGDENGILGLINNCKSLSRFLLNMSFNEFLHQHIVQM